MPFQENARTVPFSWTVRASDISFLPNAVFSVRIMPGVRSSAVSVILDTLLPVSSQRPSSAHAACRFAHRLIVFPCALCVAAVCRCKFLFDAKLARLMHRVDVRAEEEELPAALSLFRFDHPAHALHAVAAAGVLHAVRGDHEHPPRAHTYARCRCDG